MIYLIITDDHPLIRDGIKTMLSAEKDISIIGEAGNGRELLGLPSLQQADVILLDVDMPLMNGWEAAEELRKIHPAKKIIALSMYAEPAIIRKMMDSGASGYLLKNTERGELATAIMLVAGGKGYLSSDAELALMKTEMKFPDVRVKDLPEFSSRELEVIRLIADGFSNPEIGEKLFISPKTVDTHRTNIMKKAGVNNSAALVKFAISNGLL